MKMINRLNSSVVTGLGIREFWFSIIIVAGALPISPRGFCASADSREFSDRDITRAVERAVQSDTAIPTNALEVQTIDGVVTLTGAVNNLIARERAAEIAGQIRGVRAVVNRIEVAAPKRPDDELRRDIHKALFFDAATDAYELTPTVENGRVIVSGTVHSWREKQLALHVVKKVRGVREVIDDMKIDHTSLAAPSDKEITEKIRRALEIDTRVNEALIEVTVDRGKVILTGTAGTVAEKNRAFENAWVAGVQAVDMQGLKVEPWARKETRRAEDGVKGDEQIAASVRTALSQDPRVSAFMLEVSVSEGVVTLKGTVDNLQARIAAGNDAKNTTGVKRVNNLIEVKSTNRPADKEIAASIRAALGRNPITELSGITVTVNNGIAELNGTVNSALEKSEAEDIARRANGVTQVHNELSTLSPVRTQE